MLQVPVGPEAKFDMKLEEGKVKITIAYQGADADAGAFVHLKPDAFIEKLKKMIPGELDDVILEALKKSLMK